MQKLNIIFLLIFYVLLLKSGFVKAQEPISFICTTSASAKVIYVLDGLKLDKSQFHRLKLKGSQIKVMWYETIKCHSSNLHQDSIHKICSDTLLSFYSLNTDIDLNGRLLKTSEEKEILKNIDFKDIILISNKSGFLRPKKNWVIKVNTNLYSYHCFRSSAAQL